MTEAIAKMGEGSDATEYTEEQQAEHNRREAKADEDANAKRAEGTPPTQEPVEHQTPKRRQHR